MDGISIVFLYFYDFMVLFGLLPIFIGLIVFLVIWVVIRALTK
jgi:hypothetical protein